MELFDFNGLRTRKKSHLATLQSWLTLSWFAHSQSPIGQSASLSPSQGHSVLNLPEVMIFSRWTQNWPIAIRTDIFVQFNCNTVNCKTSFILLRDGYPCLTCHWPYWLQYTQIQTEEQMQLPGQRKGRDSSLTMLAIHSQLPPLWGSTTRIWAAGKAIQSTKTIQSCVLFVCRSSCVYNKITK